MRVIPEIYETVLLLEGQVMMKRLVMMLFLSMAVVANAGLFITVNGVVNPADSTITIIPSTYLELGVWNDGQTKLASLAIMGLAMGPGSLDVSGITPQQGVTAAITDNADAAGKLGLQNLFVSMNIGTTQAGSLIDLIRFHCDGPYDVEIALVNGDGEVEDTQVIHQVPEPMTLMLLGLGGLFLKRRIA
jgi:hypothetical protein